MTRLTALAFDDAATQELAKLAILLASAVAAVIGLGVLLARHALSSRRRSL